MTDFSIEGNCIYKEVFQNQYTPMMIIDPVTGNIDDANLAACDYYFYSKKELLSMNISEINMLTKQERFKKMNEVMKKNRKFIRFKHKLSSGEKEDVGVHSRSLKVGDRNHLTSIIQDTGRSPKSETEYMKNIAYFDSLFNNSPEAIAMVDDNFKIVNTNEKFEDMFQYEFEEIKGRDITRLLCEEARYNPSLKFRESITKGLFVSEEVKRRRKDGSILDVMLMGFPLMVFGEKAGAYYIYSDLTESKSQKNMIKRLTCNDSLTGLFNKDFLIDCLENEIIKKVDGEATKAKLVVLILKVNELKETSDALGHVVGNLILKEFAFRLRASVGNKNIIARFNEDEFAIMMTKIEELNEINLLTRSIVENLNAPFCIGDNELKITTSIGIATYPDDGIEGITLLRKAEIAMDKSKMSSGNSSVHFQNDYDREIQEYFWIKKDLAKSIQNEELFLNYQPIFNIVKNEVVGAEALVRWNHKEKGIIPPLKFIPIAENTGMIHSIGEWVLCEACRQNKRWQELGHEPIIVSVNVSVIQIEKPGFSSMVKQVLQDSNLEPRYLQLEITETFFTIDYELIKGTIKELSELGITFSIDDFGTGYSSLGQLSELSINNLKIDRMLIDRVDENTNKLKIVKAIISLAISLDISLTAEGVERQEELSILKENRCTMVQGYYFSRPVTSEKIEELLRNKQSINNQIDLED